MSYIIQLASIRKQIEMAGACIEEGRGRAVRLQKEIYVFLREEKEIQKRRWRME